MAIPLIPILAALAAGGSLVPHAAGGMIVTGAGGYIAGTYLSTAAIGAIAGSATAGVSGLGVAAVASFSGVATSVIGSTEVLGTTLGATGLKGMLMSIGILPSTPIVLLPIVLIGCVVASIGFVYVWRRFRKKFQSARDGREAQFTETEAKILERLIKRMGKQLPPPPSMDKLPPPK